MNAGGVGAVDEGVASQAWISFATEQSIYKGRLNESTWRKICCFGKEVGESKMTHTHSLTHSHTPHVNGAEKEEKKTIKSTFR